MPVMTPPVGAGLENSPQPKQPFWVVLVMETCGGCVGKYTRNLTLLERDVGFESASYDC